jgi:hypothetical protein
MSETVVAMTPELREQVHNAIRNEHGATFWIGDKAKGGREFPIKDLSYDDYMEFLELSRPIIQAVVEMVKVEDNGTPNGAITADMANLSIDTIVGLAGKNLPRMAWICARQSDPLITEDEVKRLARRPFHLVPPIIAQVKHNELAKEIMDFFLTAPALVTEMIPDLGAIPIHDLVSTTKATR